MFDQPPQGVTAQERDIAREEDQRSKSAGQKWLGLPKGVRRPQLRLLKSERNFGMLPNLCANDVSLMADNHRNRLRTNGFSGLQYALDHGSSSDRVKHLGECSTSFEFPGRRPESRRGLPASLIFWSVQPIDTKQTAAAATIIGH